MDAWEEVPEHQEPEGLRGLEEEGLLEILSGEDFEFSEEAEGSAQVAILISPEELEEFLGRAHDGEEPIALMLEIYANTEDSELGIIEDDGNEKPT